MPLGALMLDLDSTELDAQERELLLNPHIGGVIFFARNFVSREQIIDVVASIREIRPELLLAVDQEGGRVQRFRTGFTRLPAMNVFYRQLEAGRDSDSVMALVRDCGWLMAAEILACGVDFSFAPVLDVDDNHCAVIADRSFSPDPEQAAYLAELFIAGMHEAGMAATGKHFPGHGAVSGDSHLLLPVDERPWSQIESRDWQPFRLLAPHRLDAVMPAHIVFPQVDDQPVGFSRHWLQQRLRGDLSFDGVIFSDDLSMEGAQGAGSYGDRAEIALAAGCDMVLVCNCREGALETLTRLEQLAQPVSNRLATMSARRQWSWADLQAMPRWQQTVQQLTALTSG